MTHTYFTRGLKGSAGFLIRRVVIYFVNLVSVHPSFRPIQDLKRRCLQGLGISVGDKVMFSESLYILNHGNLSIGDGARIGAHCRIYNFNPIRIGTNLLASHGLTLISGTHDTETLQDVKGPISIGDDVWIGINVTIIGPAHIGDNVVIGAGSVVLKDIPDNSIVAGVPAKLIRMKTNNNSKHD